jgi:plasmid stabilization system protein ParE
VKCYIRPAARDDLLRQYRYLLLDQESPIAAEKFLAAAERAVRQICQRPNIGTPKPLKNPRLADLKSWPLQDFPAIRIYYLPGKAIHVLRILHGKRDINPMLENESDEP